MISAIAPGYSINVRMVGTAGGPDVDAAVANGMTQGMGRALQRAEALNGDRPDALTADGVGPARQAARIEALTGMRPGALTPDHVGPARETARAEALGQRDFSTQALHAHFLDLQSTHAPGPKSAGAMAAEMKYLQARGIVS